MFKFNKSMEKELVGFLNTQLVLPNELNSIIVNGFFECNGCYFSKKLMECCPSVSPEHFQDYVGFECFVNSFHIDDYVESHYLEYSVLFSNLLLKAWRCFNCDRELNVIVLLNEFGATIKFHLIRPDEVWLNENLEVYEDPVLITSEIMGSI